MPAPAPAIDTVIAMLETLGAELGAAGWTTRLQVAPGRAPALYVRNPEPGAAALSEHIYAAQRPRWTPSVITTVLLAKTGNKRSRSSEPTRPTVGRPAAG